MGDMSINSSGGSIPLSESPETTSSDYSSDEETFDDEDVVPLDDKIPLKESTLIFRKKTIIMDESSSPKSRTLSRSNSGFLAKTRSPTSDTRSSGLLSGPRRSERPPTVNWRKSSETSLVDPSSSPSSTSSSSSAASSSSSSLPVASPPKTFEGKSRNQRVTVILLEDGSAKDVLLDVDFLSAPPSPESLSEDIKEAINDAVSRLARSIPSSTSSSFS